MNTTEAIDKFTDDLGDWIRERVHPGLPNEEFVAVCSGMMIALNRELATCAAAFSRVNGVDELSVDKLVESQYRSNRMRATAALLKADMPAAMLDGLAKVN